MKPSEAAKIALETFAGIQAQDVQGVLIEGIQAPSKRSREWHITIGYSPSHAILGVPVTGVRVRSVIRLAEDGSFLGMHRDEDENS